MDYSLTCGTLKDGASREESAVLRALARSYAEHTHGKFTYVASEHGVISGVCSGSHSDVYFVLPTVCTCQAASRGLVCKHRVALADITGTLDRIVPNFYERFVAPGELVAAKPFARCRLSNFTGTAIP